MNKAYCPSTLPSSPLRESIHSLLTTPKAPRPVKRIHEVPVSFQAIKILEELKQENKDWLLPKNTPISHHQIIHKFQSPRRLQKYSSIPKTPDGDQLVRARRSKKGQESRFKTAASAIEFPFMIPLDDDQPVQVVDEKNNDRAEADLYGPSIGLDVAVDEEDSIVPWTIMDSLEYKVRRFGRNASLTATDEAKVSPESRIPVAVEIESIPSDWSDVSESDEEDYGMSLQETFQRIKVIPKHLESSTKTGVSRCIPKISSYARMNPAA